MADPTPLTYTAALQQTPLPARLTRANRHYNRRLQQLHTDHTNLARLHNDYKQLTAQLSSLPRQLSPFHRVPFGPLASFKGQLVHTNEWLVLLGGEWWLECTADRARRIAETRTREVERRQARVKDEEKRVREWMEEGERVMAEAGGGRQRRDEAEAGGEEDDIVEITEEYKEEEEEANEEVDLEEEEEEEARRPRMTASRSGNVGSVQKAGAMTDAEFDAYWDKLAELEEEEERREEKKQQKQSRTDTTAHSEHDRGGTVEELEAGEEAVALPAIRSPADIYKHMQQAAAAAAQPQQPIAAAPSTAEQKAATSQKKRVSFSSAQPAVALIDPVSTRPIRRHTHSPPPPGSSLLSRTDTAATAASTAVPPPSSNPALASAFSGAVLERDVVEGSDSGGVQQRPAAKKKMSRFMAERLGLKVDDD